jgi:D-3-phosphoglycerate dehydrogenase
VLVFEQFEPTGKSLDWLRERGVELTLGYALWESPFWRYSEEAFIAAAESRIGVMGASGVRFTRALIEALPDLRYISKFGIGTETIDLEAATEHGILVANTPEESQVTTVCEHAIALMLALAKQLTVWTPEFMRGGGWRGTVHARPILGATVGIVGFGRIGRGVAEGLAGWGLRILAYDPHVTAAPANVTLTDLPTLLEASDVVTLHATPTAANRHLIGRDALERMKPTAILVNTGRGWLVDYAALRERLAAGKLAGAEGGRNDPDPDSRLDHDGLRDRHGRVRHRRPPTRHFPRPRCLDSCRRTARHRLCSRRRCRRPALRRRHRAAPAEARPPPDARHLHRRQSSLGAGAGISAPDDCPRAGGVRTRLAVRRRRGGRDRSRCA